MIRLLSLALLLLALPAAAQTPAPAEPKVFRYAFEESETGFDPVQLSDLYSRNMTNNVFDAPYRFSYLAKPGTPQPNTAASLPEISSDYKRFVVHLKPGTFFTPDPAFKGKKRELVAADYVYSWKRFFDPRWKSPSYGTWELYEIVGMAALRDEAMKTGKFDYDREVPGLRVVDRYTFEIRFNKANPRFTNDMTDASILGAVAREVVEAYGDAMPEHPVGTGAFKLAEWRRSSFIAFDRNPDYREDYYTAEPDPSDPIAVERAAGLKGKRLPFLDRIEISIITESQPRWLAFLNGEQDYMERVPFDLAPLALLDGKPTPALAKRGVQIQRRPIIDTTMLLFNMDDPVIGGYTPEKIALRRAINFALDVPEIARSKFKGQASIGQSPVMPMTYGYDPDLISELGTTDVARANALLDVYGYIDRDGDGWREMPDGSPLILHSSTRPDQLSRIEDEIWKKSMDRIKVRIDFTAKRFPELLRMAREGQYQMWVLSLSASGPDGASVFSRAYGPAVGAENLCRFRNAEYDRLYLETDSIPDGPKRIENIRAMTRILAAYAPMKFPLNRYALYMTYPWVKNQRSWPFTTDWWKYVDVDMAARRKAGK